MNSIKSSSLLNRSSVPFRVYHRVLSRDKSRRSFSVYPLEFYYFYFAVRYFNNIISDIDSYYFFDLDCFAVDHCSYLDDFGDLHVYFISRS